MRPPLRDLLKRRLVWWWSEGENFWTQNVKEIRKMTEEQIVNEKNRSLVGLKEKLLCLSIDEEP